ncbi:MAG: hypothetical protein IPP99_05695 [Chitinophagaceae bacterium]|nr:hypothetical protein [Chitinophagaceae bacterium]
MPIWISCIKSCKTDRKTCYGLREDEKMTGCVTVKIRYSDFETTSARESVDYPALDDVLLPR